MHVAVIFGSVRSERSGPRVMRWVEAALRRHGHRVTRIDPAERPLPLLDFMYKEYAAGEAPETMEWIAARLREADAFVVVSAEYNHTIPPALKNLLDHFLHVTRWRPTAIVTYSAGHTGGVRAQSMLRSVMGELGTVTIPTMVDVATVDDALDESGEPTVDGLGDTLEQLVVELDWFATALARERERGVPYGEDDISPRSNATTDRPARRAEDG